jgi:hypothetical protein
MIGQTGHHVEGLRQMGMVRRCISSGGAGYALVHFKSASASPPASRNARTASSISPSVAIPVDMIVGLPIWAMRRIRGRSTFSKEAIL